MTHSSELLKTTTDSQNALENIYLDTIAKLDQHQGEITTGLKTQLNHLQEVYRQSIEALKQVTHYTEAYLELHNRLEESTADNLVDSRRTLLESILEAS